MIVRHSSSNTPMKIIWPNVSFSDHSCVKIFQKGSAMAIQIFSLRGNMVNGQISSNDHLWTDVEVFSLVLNIQLLLEFIICIRINIVVIMVYRKRLMYKGWSAYYFMEIKKELSKDQSDIAVWSQYCRRYSFAIKSNIL